MKKSYILSFIALVLLATGCSEPVAKFYKATEVCKLEDGMDLISTEGELVLPNSFYSSGNSASLLLKSSLPKDDLPTIVIYFLKERKNTMERIGDNFSEADVKIYDNDGNLVKLGEKVRLTGKKISAQCILYVDKIEKVK